MGTVNLATIGCPSYSVTTEGEVIGQYGRPLTPFAHDRTGVQMVAIKDWRGHRKTLALARLVLNTFDDVRGLESVPEHLNGDTTDCRLVNLRWRKKVAPDRERVLKMVRGLIAKYRIKPDELFPQP